jgi:hypothetical protein
MIDLLFAIERGLSVVVSFLPALVWHFASGRTQSRGGTFFGVRVEPGCAESQSGLAILREFRVVLWIGASASALISCLMPLDLAAFTGSVLTSFAAFGAFVLAHQRTRHNVAANAGPAVRVASLAVEDDSEAG